MCCWLGELPRLALLVCMFCTVSVRLLWFYQLRLVLLFCFVFSLFLFLLFGFAFFVLLVLLEWGKKSTTITYRLLRCVILICFWFFCFHFFTYLRFVCFSVSSPSFSSSYKFQLSIPNIFHKLALFFALYLYTTFCRLKPFVFCNVFVFCFIILFCHLCIC